MFAPPAPACRGAYMGRKRQGEAQQSILLNRQQEATRASVPLHGKPDGRIGRRVLSSPLSLHRLHYNIFASPRGYSCRQDVRMS
jgi:hypothetical protein